MLSYIRIKNFAVIDEVEVELDSGLSVMTGETGAGKSILVDALGLALGDRAESSAVRHGAERAEINVVFECPAGHPALDWLADKGLDDDRACALRRLVGAEGRSRAFVNGQPVGLKDLREVGALLVDIHGQHAHQSLLGGGVQRELLDAFAGAEASAQRTADAFAAWRAAAAELDDRRAAGESREAELEALERERAELEALGLEPGEVDRLGAEQARLANMDLLVTGIDTALQRLYESDLGSAYAHVAETRASLEELTEHDPALAGPAAQLAGAEIELKDAATTLMRYRDRLEPDPERLAFVENRLGRIHALARRHRVGDGELGDVLAALVAKIDALDGGRGSLAALEARAAEAERRYRDAAAALSEARKAAAAELSAKVTAQIAELGLPQGELRVAIEPKQRADATGVDRIEFQVRMNAGQPFGPLARVASGGELSRVSLALEVVAAATTAVTTYVFDEVDAGIGGGVAEIVGRRLRQVAEHRQVLCVTHLPQVASQGTRHYRVVKLSDDQTSRTQVRRLTDAERVEELSRMLGGLEITAKTRAHAEEMIESAR